jgi:hypothetical protein
LACANISFKYFEQGERNESRSKKNRRTQLI